MQEGTHKAHHPIRVPYVQDTERFRADYEARLAAYMQEPYALLPDAEENLGRVKQVCNGITGAIASETRICIEDLSATVSLKMPMLVLEDAAFKRLMGLEKETKSIMVLPRDGYVEVICYVRYFKGERSPRARAIADAIRAQTEEDK